MSEAGLLCYGCKKRVDRIYSEYEYIGLCIDCRTDEKAHETSWEYWRSIGKPECHEPSGRERFLAWYELLPEQARNRLVWEPYGKKPMSAVVLWIEILHDTEAGNDALKLMGWEE